MVKKSIGIFMIFVGILLFLSSLDIVNMKEISKFLFPSLLIIISIIGSIERKKIDLAYVIMFIVGLIIILSTLNIAGENVIRMVIIPFIVILIGLRILGFKQAKVNNSNSYTAIFGGVEEKNNDKNFKGCEITTLFGGTDIDFRDAEFKEDVVINVFCAFGGVELMFPKKYNLITKGVPIFGSLENKIINDKKTKKQIIINYTVLFGGLEIKN